jgi:hypothetical protein
MKQYLGFASGLISYACFTIYNDRKEFNRLTKEIDEIFPKELENSRLNLSDAKNNKYRAEPKTK